MIISRPEWFNLLCQYEIELKKGKYTKDEEFDELPNYVDKDEMALITSISWKRKICGVRIYFTKKASRALNRKDNGFGAFLCDNYKKIMDNQYLEYGDSSIYNLFNYKNNPYYSFKI